MSSPDDHLGKVLPVSIASSLHISINRMAMLVSAKSDRELPHAFGSQLTMHPVSGYV